MELHTGDSWFWSAILKGLDMPVSKSKRAPVAQRLRVNRHPYVVYLKCIKRNIEIEHGCFDTLLEARMFCLRYVTTTIEALPDLPQQASIYRRGARISTFGPAETNRGMGGGAPHIDPWLASLAEREFVAAGGDISELVPRAL